MKIQHLLIVLLVVLTSVGVAQDEQKKKKRKKKGRQPQVARQVTKALSALELTDEQKAKIKKVNAEFRPKLIELAKSNASVYTAEQRKARNEARKKGQAEGKKGKELQKLVSAAAKLSDEQKAKAAEGRKKNAELIAAYRKAIAACLTKEQVEKAKLLPKKRGGKKKRKKKKDN